jgi:hypothetical protein
MVVAAGRLTIALVLQEEALMMMIMTTTMTQPLVVSTGS